jgi:hypothetical protein
MVEKSSHSTDGWDIDTLKDHLITMIEAVRDQLLVRIEANDKRYGESFAQLDKSLSTALAANDRAVQAAFAAAKEAVAAQAFASKEAVNAALAAAEKAVAAAFAAAEKAVNAALLSNKEAVNKAEQNQMALNAANNEFRGQLKDQAATLQTIANAQITTDAFNAKTAELTKGQDIANTKITVLEQGFANLQGMERRLDDIVKAYDLLSTRMTLTEGAKTGAKENKSDANTNYTAILAGIGMLLGLAALVLHFVK